METPSRPPAAIVSPETATLRREVEKQRDLLITVATDGPRIKDVDREYRERRELIAKGLASLGIEDPIPFASLWDWHGRWSSGDLPTYRSRREYIRDLFAPLLERLSATTLTEGPLREPTGWARVDRDMDKLRRALEGAKHEEDFQGVGLLCREALISAGQAVFDPKRHRSPDGTEPSPTDAKRMLDAFVATELGGGENEQVRRHAKAAFDLAVALQHRRTATFRDAALCVEATTSVVNLTAIVAGRRDPVHGPE